MPIKDPIKRRENHRRYMKEVWYPKNSTKHKKMVAVNRRQKKDWFQDIKSKLFCSQCHENHPACLDFHHLGLSEKVLEVSSMKSRNFSREKITQEIKKCIVLCSNCHRKLHYNERQSL